MYRLPYTVACERSVPRARQPSLIVFLVALVWLGGFAWMRPLSLPDEGRYVGVAFEMFRSGNWITPTLDGLPFFHKPPLFYWITATAMHLFGPGDWAVRSAPILAGSATVAILYSTLRQWHGERPARMAATALATQPLFFGGSQFANMDMLVAACISSAILFGARAAMRFEAGADRRGDLVGAYIALALGVLAKGLIGLVIPVLVLLAWLGLVGHWRTLRSLVWIPGLPMVVVIVAPWFAAMQWENPDFFHYFFIVQHFERFTGSGFNNVQPAWFYVPVLFAFTLPWSLWWPAALRQSTAAQSVRPAVLSLLGVWLGIVLLFFSIPQSKPIGYMLPALAPLAALISLAAEPLIKRSSNATGWWNASVSLAAFACVAVASGFAFAHPKSSRSLTMALLAQHEVRSGVAFVDEYRYDVPFYLRDAAPIVVVSDWAPAEVRQHDNWRKELADAGSFAPALASATLLGEADFRSELCSGRIHWVFASLDSAIRHPFLNAARQVASDRGNGLWHIDASSLALASALDCASTGPLVVGAR